MRNDEGDEDGFGCARGLMWAVSLGILLWAVLIGSIALVRGCYGRASVEFGRS